MPFSTKRRFQMLVVDNSGSSTSWSVRTDAVMTATEQEQFRDAIMGLSNGACREYGQTSIEADDGINFATDADADTRHRWRVLYRDNVTLKQYSIMLPVADPSKRAPNSDNVDITTGPGQTFKTTFEQFVKSPEGNAVTVLRVDYTTV